MSANLLAAEIADRVPEFARDCKLNNEQILIRLIGAHDQKLREIISVLTERIEFLFLCGKRAGLQGNRLEDLWDELLDRALIPQDVKELAECIGLANSMILCGENHSRQSEGVFNRARQILASKKPNAEFCEWKFNSEQNFISTQCGTHLVQEAGKFNFRICGFCGKQIVK